jgi:hypothetical protein
MKKLTIKFFVLLSLAGMSVLSSCGEDTDLDPTPDQQAGSINTYRTILLTNQGSVDFPSSNAGQAFYSATANVRYETLAEAKANAAQVDFIHGIRNANAGGRILTAPSSADAEALYGGSGNPDNVTTWTPRNATKFKIVTNIDSATFYSMEDDARIVEATEAGMDSLTVKNLAAGDVVAFMTAGTQPKRGLARVAATTGPATFQQGVDPNGSITLDVKVQE